MRIWSQKLSFTRTSQLRDLQKIIEEISREIMWVNDREEEELVFNWGDKNIDVYIPNKQESYSVRASAILCPGMMTSRVAEWEFNWVHWRGNDLTGNGIVPKLLIRCLHVQTLNERLLTGPLWRNTG